VQPVVNRLQDDYCDVRQAALSAIFRLVVVGLSINYIFTYIATNPLQEECRTKIVATVQTIVGLLQSPRWVIQQIALKVIGMLAAVRESFRYPFTHVSHAS